jgi:hypothetical protein
VSGLSRRGRSPLPRISLLLAAVAAGASFSCSLARPARAAETAPASPSSIVVLCAPGDGFGQRVIAELEALGFVAVVVDPAAEPTSRASLEASARAAGAIAAIRAVPSARGVEVWIADRVTGKTVLREMTADGLAPDRDAALALRVVELLRASLLEISLPVPPLGEIPAPPQLRAQMSLPAPGTLVEKPAPNLRFSLAPGLLLSPGGFVPAASLTLDLAWMPSEHVGVLALAALPLSRPQVSGAPGSADLEVLFAGVGARFLFTTRASRWAPTADLGFAAVWLRSAGTGNAGFRGGSDTNSTAAPFVRLGLAFAVTPLFRLRADVLTGVITQGTSIQLAEHQVASWGQPFVLPAAGVDFGWF